MRKIIDQSGKLEYTRKDTALASSNLKQKSLLIKAKEKRKLKLVFRQANKPYIFIYKTFAVLIYFLIREDLTKIETIVIDVEYQGKDALIKDFLLQLIRKNHKTNISKADIQFQRIGKKAKAHERAIQTFRGDIRPDIIVKAKDVMPFVL